MRSDATTPTRLPWATNCLNCRQWQRLRASMSSASAKRGLGTPALQTSTASPSSVLTELAVKVAALLSMSDQPSRHRNVLFLCLSPFSVTSILSGVVCTLGTLAICLVASTGHLLANHLRSRYFCKQRMAWSSRASFMACSSAATSISATSHGTTASRVSLQGAS